MKLIKGLLILLSLILIFVSIAGDYIGLGGERGIGSRQKLALVSGIVLFFVSVLILRPIRKEKKDKAFNLEKMLANIFILIISLLLAFFTAEIISRLLSLSRLPRIERIFLKRVIRYPKPYVMFGGRPYARTDTGDSLNRLGYRGDLPGRIKQPDEFRIFLLGGSTVFGGGSPIPALLEEEFTKNGFRNVKVYNFGVISSSSGMELSRILFEVSEFEPDLIVMYNGNNDIYDPLHYDPRPGYPYNFITYQNNPLLESDLESYPLVPLILYGSNLVRYLFPSYITQSFIPLDEEKKKVKYGTEEWRSDIANAYVKNLVKAHKISDAFGAKFMAFFQPTLYYKDNLSVEEKYKFMSYESAHYLDVRSKIISEIKKIREDVDIKFIDLSDIYDETSEWVFNDCCHPKQTAEPIIASTMFEYMIKECSFNGK